MIEIYLIYVGKGASIFGVPARNLTWEEAQIHSESRLLLSGLYKLAKSKERKLYSKRTKNETEEEVNNG